MTEQHTTRAELLAEQHAQVRSLERRLTSVRRLLIPWLEQALALAGGLLAIGALSRDPGAVGWQVVGVFAGALVVVVARRHGARTRALERELRHWADLDRTAASRALPPGDLRTADRDLRTVYDARDDADLPAVAADRAMVATLHLRDLRLVPVPVLSALPGLLGLVVLLGPLLGDYPLAARLVGVAVGGGCMVTAMGTWVTMTRETLRRQGLLNMAGLEREAYLARARALGTADTPPDPQLPRWARPLSALAVAREKAGSPPGPRRPRATYVVPLGSGGTDLLHGAGSGRVRVEIVASGLRLIPADAGLGSVELSAADVLTIEPANLMQLGSPDGVVVVTPGDPVVLGGRGIREYLAPLRRGSADAVR